jgi:hypothetical protein
MWVWTLAVATLLPWASAQCRSTTANDSFPVAGFSAVTEIVLPAMPVTVVWDVKDTLSRERK